MKMSNRRYFYFILIGSLFVMAFMAGVFNGNNNINPGHAFIQQKHRRGGRGKTFLFLLIDFLKLREKFKLTFAQ